MFNFLHTYTPDPIAFQLGSIDVRWYGLMIALGAVIGVLVAVRLGKRYGIKSDDFYDFVLYAVIAAIIGARLYYVLYAWEYYRSNLGEVFAIWEGGLAIHGAIIGGILALIWFAQKKNIDMWRFMDVAVVGLIIGQIMGRWGNYFNQELFGTPTDLPWGIPIEEGNRPQQFLDSRYFHPTFLYESLLNSVLLIILLVLHKLKGVREKMASGTIALIYFIGYGCIRFFTETLRTDFSPEVYGMRWASVISVFIILLSISLLIHRNKRNA